MPSAARAVETETGTNQMLDHGVGADDNEPAIHGNDMGWLDGARERERMNGAARQAVCSERARIELVRPLPDDESARCPERDRINAAGAGSPE